MTDNYEALITIPVSIPPEMIEGPMSGTEYEDIEEWVISQAEMSLQDIIREFRAVVQRG